MRVCRVKCVLRPSLPLSLSLFISLFLSVSFSLSFFLSLCLSLSLSLSFSLFLSLSLCVEWKMILLVHHLLHCLLLHWSDNVLDCLLLHQYLLLYWLHKLPHWYLMMSKLLLLLQTHLLLHQWIWFQEEMHLTLQQCLSCCFKEEEEIDWGRHSGWGRCSYFHSWVVSKAKHSLLLQLLHWLQCAEGFFLIFSFSSYI